MLALVILAVPLLLVTACADEDDDGPDRMLNPDIRGAITSAGAGCTDDEPGAVLVEGEIEADTQYDKASVNLKGAAVFRVTGDELTEIGPCDLAEGDIVEVWFEGPVAESYPVQARAGTVYLVGQD